MITPTLASLLFTFECKSQLADDKFKFLQSFYSNSENNITNNFTQHICAMKNYNKSAYSLSLEIEEILKEALNIAQENMFHHQNCKYGNKLNDCLEEIHKMMNNETEKLKKEQCELDKFIEYTAKRINEEKLKWI
ncbi:hypothetical protein ACQ4LE_004920 [Meloidogyne hapla]|uniref:Uncharacterized protein n=1 Tax=Meloidogyne hapla TaxID=6305 RepID=A0A1I8BH61_MELHA